MLIAFENEHLKRVGEKGEQIGSISVQTEVEVSLRKCNFSNSIALGKPFQRDLPIILISAYQSHYLHGPQTVTFESYYQLPTTTIPTVLAKGEASLTWTLPHTWTYLQVVLQ